MIPESAKLNQTNQRLKPFLRFTSYTQVTRAGRNLVLIFNTTKTSFTQIKSSEIKRAIEFELYCLVLLSMLGLLDLPR